MSGTKSRLSRTCRGQRHLHNRSLCLLQPLPPRPPRGPYTGNSGPRLPTWIPNGESLSHQPCCALSLPHLVPHMKSAQSPGSHSSGTRYSYTNWRMQLSHRPLCSFAGFLLSCIGISLAAARNRGIKSTAALLGVV